MRKRLVSENFTCEELEDELIKEFKSMNCDEIESFAILNWKRLDEEIPEKEKENQVTEARSKYNFKEEKFAVKNFQEIFDKHIIEYTYLNIYISSKADGSDLNLVCKFSEIDGWQEDFTNDADTKLYKLERGILTLVSTDADFENVKRGVDGFNEYFNKNFDSKSFTKYVTFHLEKIKRNFRKFNNDCIIWIGARQPYKRDIMRPNLILEIDRECVRNPININSTSKQYFNMGSLYP